MLGCNGLILLEKEWGNDIAVNKCNVFDAYITFEKLEKSDQLMTELDC